MNELLSSQSQAGAGSVGLEVVHKIPEELLADVPSVVQTALDQQPSLVRHKSFGVDLAYAKFVALTTAGETIDPVEFCNRYPEYRSSLRHRLADHFSVGFSIAERIRQADLNVLWPDAGEQFGEYTILRHLGMGSFARVYLATEPSTGDRPVVLKLSVGDNTEGRTLGRLAHEHIVPVLYARKHESGLSLVCMPYLGSATLHDLLDRAYQNPQSPPRHARLILETVQAAQVPGDPVLELAPPPAYLTKGTWVDGVVHLGERLASALAFVHKRGIRHRDIKPSNILLDASARPRLLDFNLSEDERLDSFSTGGTLPYMAPEQLRHFLSLEAAEPKPDGRADLFALAVILYELLSGHHPFGLIPVNKVNEEMAQLLLERQKAGCMSLQKLNPDLDRKLAALIESCLAFKVDDRPASAAAFAAALQRRFAPSRVKQVMLCSLGGLAIASSGFFASSGLTPTAMKPTTTNPAPVLSAEEEYAAGRQAFENGDYDKADACFERALKAAPKEERYLFASGRTRLTLNDATTAESRFATLWNQRSDDPARAHCVGLQRTVEQSVPPRVQHIL